MPDPSRTASSGSLVMVIAIPTRAGYATSLAAHSGGLPVTRRKKHPLRPLTDDERDWLMRVARSGAEPAAHVVTVKSSLRSYWVAAAWRTGPRDVDRGGHREEAAESQTMTTEAYAQGPRRPHAPSHSPYRPAPPLFRPSLARSLPFAYVPAVRDRAACRTRPRMSGV